MKRSLGEAGHVGRQDVRVVRVLHINVHERPAIIVMLASSPSGSIIKGYRGFGLRFNLGFEEARGEEWSQTCRAYL